MEWNIPESHAHFWIIAVDQFLLNFLFYDYQVKSINSLNEITSEHIA